MNLSYKEERLGRASADQIRERRQAYLSDEKRIKAVTVCFTDLEGRLHMLDYDKKFLLRNDDNLTFDGSSIRGFSQQAESDLRLAIDWTAFYMVPADIFGPGKVVVFGDVLERGGHPYGADMRLKLKQWCEQAYKKDGTVFHVATEIEGFLFKGKDAERRYTESGKFEFVSTGGYYHSLPGDALRTFIDRAAEVQRAMGFENEKDHPEVAPSQFEMNFSYSDALAAADQVQLYKLLCRQVAAQTDLTASFLPKPVTGVNGSGMHTNLSIARAGKNLFHDPTGKDGLSKTGWDVIDRILTSANDIALVLNPSVNAYRRLDPHYEAPNQITASAINRGAMVRIPLGNERSARIEVRSVAPDANPYMVFYTLIRTGLDGPTSQEDAETKRSGIRLLPGNIIDAIRLFKSSGLTSMLYGEEVRDKFAELKQMAADRCPKQLGTLIKPAEVQFHHEVTNQWLWSMF
ncbi:MAG: glutamine synthetase family protein [Nitrospira sp.]|nr:glutamine synthetase family protein [Nitrospira sp.]MDH4243294.1 glutamine synthetase family protein [Nitrospira sp.]MDH4356308.1 glutamine synthetase family protein [Nitrospira sp.]